MSEKLLPCPFCGSENVSELERENDYGETIYAVGCQTCDCCTEEYGNPYTATKKWNTRADNAEITCLCEALSAYADESNWNDVPLTLTLEPKMIWRGNGCGNSIAREALGEKE